MSLDSAKSPVTASALRLDLLDVQSSPDSASDSPSSLWDDSDNGRIRRSRAPSPECLASHLEERQFPSSQGSTMFPCQAWGALEEQSNTAFYEQLARNNPYSQTTPIPGGTFVPLRAPVGGRCAESSSVLSPSGGSGSKNSLGGWTDDECKSEMSF